MQPENTISFSDKESLVEREARLWSASTQYADGEIDVKDLGRIEASIQSSSKSGKKTKVSVYAANVQNRYSGGLIAVSLVILQAFIGSPSLDTAALISIVAISAALPLLSGILVIGVIEGKYAYGSPRTTVTYLVRILFILGISLSVIGIEAAIWHVSWIAGTVSTVSSMFAAIIYTLYVADLEEPQIN